MCADFRNNPAKDTGQESAGNPAVRILRDAGLRLRVECGVWRLP